MIVALVPWTIRSERVVAALGRQIAQAYGIDLTSNGRLTLTLLPLPQLVLSGVRLLSRDGTVEVEADELRTQLRLLPLLQARLRLHKLWLAKSSIAVTIAEEPGPTVAGSLTRLRSLLGAQHGSRWVPRIDRFILTEADIGVRDRAGRELARLWNASLVLNSPEPDGDLDFTGSARWNGETAILSLSGVSLAAVRDGLAHPIQATFSGPLGRLSLDGRLTWSERPAFSGSWKGNTISLARLARWTGLGADLRDVDRTASVTGEGALDLDKLQWPRAAIEIGRDRLDGALGVQFGERPQIRATVAADDLDLGWLGRLVDPKGDERLDADYDVRLSASALSLGPLRLRDAALSMQSTARGIEVSLGRAVFAGGSLRGRVSANLDGEGRDMRALAWIDAVDLERALVDISSIRAASGSATGQLSLDITGERGGELLPHIHGRGTLQTRDGEFALAAFSEAKRDAQAMRPPDWRANRVRFNQTVFGFEFRDGRAEVNNGVIETSGTRATLGGSIDLGTRDAALRLAVQPTIPARASTPLILELKGPLRRLILGAIGP